MIQKISKIWITWERQRRTIELSGSLRDVALFLIELDAPRAIRYPYLLLRTLHIFLCHRPRLVFVQNPSVVLSLFTVLFSKVMGFSVIIDAHNEGLKPFYRQYDILLPFYKWIQKSATLTIVTNSQLAREVISNGGVPFVLEDAIPQIHSNAHIALKGEQNIAFVCTFEKDEPYMAVIQSGKFLDSSIYIYITGKWQKCGLDLVREAPENILFSGFLPEQSYKNLLDSCDAVMDLTLMRNCLVCGAYEAVALEKPLIVSDTFALRSYFSMGTIYTENTPQAIAHAIDYAIVNKARLEDEMRCLKKELKRNWQVKFEELLRIIEDVSSE